MNEFQLKFSAFSISNFEISKSSNDLTLREALCRVVMKSPCPLGNNLNNNWPAEIVSARHTCDSVVKQAVDNLTKIDSCLAYASLITSLIYHDKQLQDDWITALTNVAFFYREIALSMLQEAYDITITDKGQLTPLWSTSGQYLRKGLGIIQFVKGQLDDSFKDVAKFDTLNQLAMELNLIQQLGIITLSLTKLQNSITNDESHELDLQTNGLRQSTKLSLFYAKLCIGCKEACIQMKLDDSNSTSFINLHNSASNEYNNFVNNNLIAYLDGLAYLLISLDQYRKDQYGTSIGLLEQSINAFCKIIPREKLIDEKLSSPRLKLKMKDKLKNKIQSTVLKTKQESFNKLHMKAHEKRLLPILNDTLNCFIVPLINLLNYVYQQTNDKLFFQPVERNVELLNRLVPKGKLPSVEPIVWCFEDNVIQEYRDFESFSNENVNSNNSNSNLF